MSPSCLSPMVQCSKNLNLGPSKPAEENKRELFPFYELFVLGDSTVCTTLVALSRDTVLRSTSPPSFGRNASVFGFIVHVPIPLLSTYVQKFLNSLHERSSSVTSCGVLLFFHPSLLASCWFRSSCTLSIQVISLLSEQAHTRCQRGTLVEAWSFFF